MLAVIGIGNTMRGDDAIGPTTIAALADRLETVVGDEGAVELTVLDGEPARLIEAWRDRDLVIVIDAAVGRGTPGQIHRLDATTDPLPGPGPAASSHRAGLAEAVSLSRALDKGPRQLIVYAMEVADVSLGARLSDEVQQALPHLIDRVLAEVQEAIHGV